MKHVSFAGYKIKEGHSKFLLVLKSQSIAQLTVGGIDLETLLDDITGYGEANPTRSYSYNGNQLTISQQLGDIPDGTQGDAWLLRVGYNVTLEVDQRIETLLGA